MDPILVKDDWDTTPSLSPLNSDDLALDDDSDSSLPSSDRSAPGELPSTLYILEEPDPKFQPPFSNHHLQLLDQLRDKQYWRQDWESSTDVTRSFDLGDPSTLGPSIENARATGRHSLDVRPSQVRSPLYPRL